MNTEDQGKAIGRGLRQLIDFIVNIIYWLGFVVLLTVGLLGLIVGLMVILAVCLGGAVMLVAGCIVCVVPFLPFVGWCAAFERHRWDSFIRSITAGRMKSSSEQAGN